MKKKTSILIFLVGFSTVLFAQGTIPVQFDALTKIVGFIMVIGGLFLGYSNMKTASKVADLEIKLTKALSDVKAEFNKAVDEVKKEFHSEVDNMKTKMELSNKELESKMSTKHDISNLKTIMGLQYDFIKEQLKVAAEINKKENG